jgi:hypothetical protein
MDHRFAGRSTSCQRRAIFFSSLQGCTRHAFPSPANDQYHHQPYQLLRSGQIHNTGEIRQTFDRQANPVGRPAVDWNLVVLKIALRQSQHIFLKTLFGAALRPIQQLQIYRQVRAMRVVLF